MIRLVSNCRLLQLLVIAICLSACGQGDEAYFQCITDSDSNLGVKAYVVEIDAPETLKNPGLVFLARGVDSGEAFALVNGNRYEIPPLLKFIPEKYEAEESAGKEGWYRSESDDEMLGKLVLPLAPEHLNNGVNRVIFDINPAGDGYSVFDARIASVKDKQPGVVQLTYRVVTRGEQPKIDDFDFVLNYNGEGKRVPADLPEWAERGKVRYYRAGINWDHIDRLFEMFEEGHFNLVMLQVSTPHDLDSEEYGRYKAFIDRCHESGIKVTFDGGAGGQAVRLNSISVRSIEEHPEMMDWVARDESGEPRTRSRGRSYWPDLNNREYKQAVLETAGIAIDAGVDELYYDWAIGGTKGIMGFFLDVQDLIAAKGKNLTVFGNCKGNILADGVCDIGKSEGTEEAGVWDGKWVHNDVQARFYYAAGDGWKPYRSKYEGADPGRPNPGAHSVIDDMKIGWKRPMAEAKAFQSDFVVAEAGRRMLNGWLNEDNEVAMRAWRDICAYNSFFAAHEALFTDVTTVSRLGLIAPPLIPSFEASVKRISLYNALSELNIMYDVLLLPRITPAMLAKYDLLLIPDIPWLKEKELATIRTYKEGGGNIYTIGSCPELREVASLTSPASLCADTDGSEVKEKLIKNFKKLSLQPLIVLEETRYVLANVVRKSDSGKILLHFVNYARPVENLTVNVFLGGILDSIDPGMIRMYSPDAVPREVKNPAVSGTSLSFTIPKLEIYTIVTIN